MLLLSIHISKINYIYFEVKKMFNILSNDESKKNKKNMKKTLVVGFGNLREQFEQVEYYDENGEYKYTDINSNKNKKKKKFIKVKKI